MSKHTNPSFLKFENAGWHDRMANRESQYDALKAAGSPFAETYKRGYEMPDDIAESFLRAS